MLGQLSLFQPDKQAKLKNRVEIEIISVEDARYVLERFHYLHRTRVGRQINYAVLVDGVVDGVITYAYPMMSAPINGVPSDEIIEFARLYLHRNIPHTATCAIGKSLRRIVRDWMRLFPDSKAPKMIVSWSDTTRHRGTIYKASNFIHLHRTTGDKRKALRNSPSSKRGVRVHSDDYRHDKDCWIYELQQQGVKHG